MARCVKVDAHEDYHHHCYGDYYVSVSVDPFEHVHSSLPFLKGSLVLEFFGSKITAVSGALPCDKLGQSNFQIRTKASELRTVVRLQVHLSGGEPGARRDLVDITAGAQVPAPGAEHPNL
jgi:hypothetical protein